MSSALLVACLALIFTVTSFWWLNARRGSLQVGAPGAYAFTDNPRLRLPIAFYNTGARALVVTDLRLLLVDGAAQPPLLWIATTSGFRPKSEAAEERDFATPFAVPGRGTRELVIEFGHEQGWSPELGSKHRVRLEAKYHDRLKWRKVGEFDWFAPPPGAELNRYIAYRNASTPIPSAGRWAVASVSGRRSHQDAVRRAGCRALRKGPAMSAFPQTYHI